MRQLLIKQGNLRPLIWLRSGVTRHLRCFEVSGPASSTPSQQPMPGAAASSLNASLFLPGSSIRLSLARFQAAAPEAEQAQADVYAFEPQPLEEGVRKHMLSVFVADESGLINRVAVSLLAANTLLLPYAAG